jgi:hypothetical protein
LNRITNKFYLYAKSPVLDVDMSFKFFETLVEVAGVESDLVPDSGLVSDVGSVVYSLSLTEIFDEDQQLLM